MIIGVSGSGKTKTLLNLTNHEPDIEKAKYQFLINKRESTGLKYLNGSKAFIEYSNDKDVICKNIEEYNPIKKQKVLIVFDDMLSNKKLNTVVTEFYY